ncbi:HAD hydrolase family protein [Bacillus sp. SM2101]|uniref:HAD hydrolase family protein n=1 Tax=Bacillus sp. SM2101 TaxID=2805366 RepID=UPI001BDEF8EA|nr:HAD hydrolase family protein [Bacillus sp. SM2101]
MRIVIDLDGTICELKKANQSYQDVKPKEGAIEAIHNIRNKGHEIIIYTARNMKTCDGNLGKVNANIGKLTIDWLDFYNVPYDEIIFGKPYGDIYIDDLAITFRSWDEIENIISKSEPK